jgi:dual specificity tyrosine-phosphorylation-regulated kinase 2/3/4
MNSVISDSHFQSSLPSHARAAPSNSSTSSFEHIYHQAMDIEHSRATPTQNSPSRPFKDRNPSNASADFLPSISFDDLHSSITGVDADLNTRFPALSSAALSMASLQAAHQNNSRQTNGQGLVKPGEPAGKISRSGSLVRRFSTSRRQASQSSIASDTTQMPPPSSLGSARGRRQSTLQSGAPQAGSASTRFARKSIGPGFGPPNNTASRSGSRDARVPPTQSQPTQSQPSLARTGSINKSNRPGSLLPNPHSNDTSNRNSRTKSLQPPPRGQNHLLSQSVSSVGADGSPIIHSPRPRNRAQTPSSGGNNSNRRLSTLYVGGLGARTISPTDARRMKRLSSVPKVPSPPQPVPPISQPDMIPGGRQMSQSPATYVRKPGTPSSARNTPDPGKRNGALNQSVSSSSSFSSLRLSNVNGPTSRPSQVVTNSRLPTPKPRNVHSSTGFVEDEVPPVPAIPKAYESPKDQIPEPYFPIPRKSLSNDSDDQSGSRSLPPSRSATSRPIVQQYQNITESQNRGQGANQRHRRGLTVGAGSDSERSTAQPNLSKKNLQPLRLPPLNLLPLSTPTSSRIASLPSGEADSRHATPPPKRNVTKTPSTPMTASKATFFSRPSGNDDEFSAFGNFRSSSSHQPLRPNEIESKTSYFDMGAPIPIPMAGPRNNASPFASNSLPKLTDFGPLSPPPSISTPILDSLPVPPSFRPPPIEVDLPSAPQPSPKVIPQVVQIPNPPQSFNSDEPSTPASTTSLRRKLSLTWKRSSSKASQRAQAAQNERDEAKAKQNEMPPPKIPASATWSSRTSTDTGSNRPSLDIRPRKPSNSMAQMQADGSGSDSSKVENGPPPPYSDHRRPVPRSSSSSLLTPVQRMLGAKGSLSTLKNRNLDTNLDKDDLAADKIMEKLASKRKDFEHAAKEVDELRRRAHPKDRVSPVQAIQMVNLNIFERGEIVDFKDVYFCGNRNAKKIIGDPNQTSTNFGYDDDRGDYNIVLGDHLAYRYEVIDVLGKGSFGQVVRCIDHKTGGLVAVKIIRNKKRFHQQALVEVNILQKLRDWVSSNVYEEKSIANILRILITSTV